MGQIYSTGLRTEQNHNCVSWSVCLAQMLTHRVWFNILFLLCFFFNLLLSFFSQLCSHSSALIGCARIAKSVHIWTVFCVLYTSENFIDSLGKYFVILMRAVFKWYLINDATRFVLTFVFPRILSQCKKKKISRYITNSFYHY